MNRCCSALLCSLAVLFSALFASPGMAQQERPEFGVRYTVWIKPEEEAAVVKIRLNKNPDWVHWLEMTVDPDRHRKFLASGELTFVGDKVRWHPPKEDAWLQYRVEITNKRNSGGYDAMITPEWALFRADLLVPPIRSDFRDFTQSEAKLTFNLPEGWSVKTRYPRYTSGRHRVDDPDRLFDRPTGWLVMGRIGTRIETIGHTNVAVAGPVDQGVRHMDTLAFFRWTIPVLQDIFPRFPERLLIVSATDPMWRGALSGPGSLYVHSDRPMISGNGTSTFIHELVHVAMSARSGPNADWITEGLAEYYSLEVLRRSGTISDKRFESAHAKLAEWGRDVDNLEVERSSGAITARAVGELRRIDREIREKSGGARSLDDVVKALAAERAAITNQRFRELVSEASQVE